MRYGLWVCVGLAIALLGGVPTSSAQAPFDSNRHFQSEAGQVRWIQAGDIDEDGHLDLTTTEGTAPAVMGAFMGDGAGGFTFRIMVTLPATNVLHTLLDLNGDEHLDIVALMWVRDSPTAWNSHAELLVLLGDGTGSFSALDLLPLGPRNLGRPIIADWNEDGFLDVATPHWDENVISIALGAGDGTFFQVLLQPVPFTVGDIVTADFDGDGHLDLAVATYEPLTRRMAVLNGRGDGTFSSPRFFDLAWPSTSPSSLVAADFDQDGYMDVALAASTRVAYFMNDGAGSFEPMRALPVVDGWVLRYLTVGDFDEDGYPDLAAVTGLDRVAIYRSDGAGDLRDTWTAGTTRDPINGVIGDFDEDGHLDLAYAAILSRDIAVLKGDGRGRFATPRWIPTDGRYAVFATGDFDEDGIDDVVVTDDSGFLQFFPVRPGVGITQATTRTAFGRPRGRLLAGDFDEDGHLDVLVGVDPSVALGIRLARGDGRGGFEPMPPFQTGQVTGTFAAVDMNLDGHLDVLVNYIDPIRDRIAFKTFLGDGQGSFVEAATLVTNAFGMNDVDVLDVKRDGIPDFLVSFYEEVVILLGDGAGGFSGTRGIGTLGSPGRVAVGDWNRDGLVDLAVGDEGSPRGVQIHFGRPDTFFSQPQKLVSRFIHPVAGDLDGDDDIDLVLWSGPNSLEPWRNDGTGHFTSDGERIGTDYRGVLPYVGDFDGDGDNDILLTNGLVPSLGLITNLLQERRVRTGTVNLAQGGPADVLRVNGSIGNERRELRLSMSEPVTFSIDPTPAGPDPGRFLLYGAFGEPSGRSLTRLPFGIGTIAMAIPGVAGDARRTRAIFNHVGHEARLGRPLLPSTPAPFAQTVNGRPNLRGRFTVQGIIDDGGSAASVPVSVTNALVLDLVR